MEKKYEQVKSFLGNPETWDDFMESEAVVWIDWREYDEDIVKYFNDEMEEKIEIRFEDHGKPYGEDIVLKRGVVEFLIPYGEVMDRDTTICSLNRLIQPKEEIRFCVDSLGNDTLGFTVLPTRMWNALEEVFHEKVYHYFAPIGTEEKLFELTFGEVSRLLDLRERNENADFRILSEFVKLSGKEHELKEQKENGRINLVTYLKEKKKCKKCLEDFVSKYPEIDFGI